ncbi:MAG: hypothetical protein WBD31_16715, partial [Rubripirellula sp.]
SKACAAVGKRDKARWDAAAEHIEVDGWIPAVDSIYHLGAVDPADRYRITDRFLYSRSADGWTLKGACGTRIGETPGAGPVDGTPYHCPYGRDFAEFAWPMDTADADAVLEETPREDRRQYAAAIRSRKTTERIDLIGARDIGPPPLGPLFGWTGFDVYVGEVNPSLVVPFVA